MPSRSNPNTPSALKKKSAAVLKSKRKNTQRIVKKSKAARTTAAGGLGKIRGSSQAIRKEEARRRKVVREGKKGRKGERMEGVEVQGKEREADGRGKEGGDKEEEVMGMEVD
ncbi:hypothetical protein MMC26_001210 [Xylographa opegraphella]|nr:hypothetical protein [Xylographa opegraphella]